MAYDFDPRVVEQWTFEAQAALWRERAVHQAQRADFFKRLAEAERNGTTIEASGKEPRI